jgi:prepilin-type N-terminal cleavage/methylation domain-containing protein
MNLKSRLSHKLFNKFLQKSSWGFTLIELMIVVAIIAFLSIIAVPNIMNFLAKAKRTEVYVNLGAIWTAEKYYYSEHGRYSDALTGSNGIGWHTEGEPLYTYGFAGTDGVNYITGKLKASGADLSKYSSVGPDNFTVVAIGDIDGDGKLDVITMNDRKQIKIVEDDCA